ncbi:MAG: hypothetical protein OEY23_11725 [Acidimicrobiia bacterium]|nr:hypothetical protein [Acidimicrobiia bacterium]
MNTDDLRHDLEALGRRPVPEAQPEFVEALLARLTIEGEFLAPVPLAAHRAAAVRRIGVIATIAAAIAAVVGLVSMNGIERPPQAKSSPSLSPSVLEIHRISDQVVYARVGSDGLVRDLQGALAEDGSYNAVCSTGGVISASAGDYPCETEEAVTIVVVGGRIESVRGHVSLEQTGGDTDSSLAELTYSETDNVLRLEWPAATAPVAGYAVLRVAGAADALGTPAYPADRVAEVVEPVFEEDLNEAFEFGTEQARYAVVAVDAAGEVVERYEPLHLNLKWSRASEEG